MERSDRACELQDAASGAVGHVIEQQDSALAVWGTSHWRGRRGALAGRSASLEQNTLRMRGRLAWVALVKVMRLAQPRSI
jgi:hypothetical protein